MEIKQMFTSADTIAEGGTTRPKRASVGEKK